MFSRSENIIIEHTIKGLSNKEMAELLCVSEKAIKWHLTNIYRKSNVKSRAQLIAKEYEIKGAVEEKEPPIQLPTTNKMETPMLNSGSNPISPVGLQKNQEINSRQRSQEDKIIFINDKFMIGETIGQLLTMMKDVVSKELNPNTVNAACNCVARLNETIQTAIQAAKFLNER